VATCHVLCVSHTLFNWDWLSMCLLCHIAWDSRYTAQQAHRQPELKILMWLELGCSDKERSTLFFVSVYVSLCPKVLCQCATDNWLFDDIPEDLRGKLHSKIITSILTVFKPFYRGADKSLAQPGRKQANISVRMAWISFDALPCRK